MLKTRVLSVFSSFQYLEKEGYLPLKIFRQAEAKEVTFPGGSIEIKNKTSSQFVTALLMVAPLSDTPITLRLLDLETCADGSIQAVSQPYINMTIEMMKTWGIAVERLGPGLYEIPTGDRFGVVYRS